MNRQEFLNNTENAMMAHNVVQLTRANLSRSLFNENRDINFACGYPNFISIANYKAMYDRVGLANRVVRLAPEESWRVDPVITEEEKAADTDFEKDWKALQKEHHIYSYLQRVDILSRIGRFGVLLIGISDGETLDKPVTNIDENTGKVNKTPTEYELLYLRPFDESFVQIKLTETEISSPRFGFPKMYTIRFENTSNANITSVTRTMDVHWTRILHVADNREVSEINGVPTQKPVYNRVLDYRKILGGSGEFFWKGAFPGYSFEINKDLKNPTLDATSIREEFKKYTDGTQRYLALEGVTAKSLAIQAVSPKEHVLAQLQSVALTLGIPLRILLGSEQAKLASVQDKETWNIRVARRQNQYLSPFMVEPMVQRLIDLGIIKAPKDGFISSWPDLNAPTDKDKAEIGRIRAEALSKYIAGDISSIMTFEDFLIHVLKLESEVVKVIIENADKMLKDVDEPDSEEEGDDE